MLVKTFAAAVQGISATIITIEVNCTKGVQFFLVGLPDVAVRESHERIISALQVNGYKFPRNRIVINMAPADIRKEGSAYDLPLAIGILAGAEQISSDKLSQYMSSIAPSCAPRNKKCLRKAAGIFREKALFRVVM